MNIRLKKGFSTIQLAVAVAMASAGGYAGMDVVEGMASSSQVHSETQYRFALRTTVQGAFDRQGNFEGLSNRIAKSFLNTPTTMKRGEGDNLLTNWADDGIRLEAENLMGRKNNAFSMTYLEVDQRGCVGMSSNYDSFAKVEVNGITTYDSLDKMAEKTSLLTFEYACEEGSNTLKFYSF